MRYSLSSYSRWDNIRELFDEKLFISADDQAYIQ